jgi:hypothetical protein
MAVSGVWLPLVINLFCIIEWVPGTYVIKKNLDLLKFRIKNSAFLVGTY